MFTVSHLQFETAALYQMECGCGGEGGSTKNDIVILIGQFFLPEQVITVSSVVYYHFHSLG